MALGLHSSFLRDCLMSLAWVQQAPLAYMQPHGLCHSGSVIGADLVGAHSQFPGSKEEEGLQREPEGAKQARREGRTPEVDTPEEAAAPAHEYEFQPQVSAPGFGFGLWSPIWQPPPWHCTARRERCCCA